MIVKPMTLVFLCGSLEPGKDGVGDYTRLLAQECVRMGHTCVVVALNDTYVSSNPIRTPFIIPKGLTLLRFRNLLDTHFTKNLFYNFLQEINPDCISLQFVPYSFSKYGFCHSLNSLLKPIAKKYLFEIMFHELFIGIDAHPSLKHRIIGFIQRKQIKYLLKILHPVSIHTHTPFYKELLKDIGYPSELLPLFSLIKPNPKDETNTWLYPLLQSHYLPIESNNRNNYWLFGIFGSMHNEWPPYPLLDYINTACEKNKKQGIILHFGNIGKGNHHWKAITLNPPSHISFLTIGPLTSPKVSTLFQNLDYGIATSPYHLVSKSASAISMIESGLPVIINRFDYPPEIPYLPHNHTHDLFIRISEKLPDTLHLYNKKTPLFSIEKITHCFLESIDHHL